MKKLVALVLIGILVTSNQAIVYADEKQVRYDVVPAQEEISSEGIQKVHLHLSEYEKVSEIDLAKSYIVLKNNQEEERVYGLVKENNDFYFTFAIKNTLEEAGMWDIKEINLINKAGVKMEVSFALDNTKFNVLKQAPIAGVKEEEVVKESSEIQTERVVSTFSIGNVNFKDGYGSYTITGTIDSSVKKVLIPTWSSKNGQDDLEWKEASINGNTFTCIVNMRDHKNESGEYNSHIYTYDANGNASSVAYTYMMKASNPTVYNVNVAQGDGQYTITGNIGGDVTKVQVPTWTGKNGQDDLEWKEAKIVGDSFSVTIDSSAHKNEVGNYISHIYSYNAAGKIGVKEINQNMTKILPKTSNVKLVNGNGSYTITGTVNSKVKKVLMATWTEKNGQDDIVWEEVSINGNSFSYTVKARNHKNDAGKYNTHIYAYGANNELSVQAYSTSIASTKPSVSNVTVTQRNGDYVISGKVSGTVTKLMMPTWTERNGQDDLVWEEVSISGDSFSHIVTSRNHKNETGRYTTHIYAYDDFGNCSTYATGSNMKFNPPEIKKVSTSGGAGTYTVNAEISGNVTKVLFATWTSKNGQDDLVWTEGKISSNSASYVVDKKDHNFEVGAYITHVYAYDANGNVVVKSVNKTMQKTAPIISNVVVSDISAQGYLVTCTVSSAYKLDKVLFPTWTSANGQDDMNWGTGTIEGNKVSYRVYVKDHNFDFGNYNTHIYAYDASGALTSISIPKVSVNSSNLSAGWEVVNGHKYLYDAEGKIVEGSGMLVIDISEHNGNVDWQAVKNAGVDAVILRSGYGYESNQMDDTFKRNVSELNRLGIPYGIYHFSYARDIGEGKYEAEYMLNCMREAGARPTLPVYYDLEYDKYVGEKSNEFYTQITKEFASVVQNAGYQVGVYANYNWWTTKLTDSSFDSYVKWVAHYGTTANNEAGTANPNWHPDNEFKMWQYSSQGKVNGISGNVDVNVLLNWK